MSADLASLLPPTPNQAIQRLSDGTVVGRFYRSDLSSVFQPVVAADSNLLFGHEAFVRAHGGGGQDLTPWNLFSLVANDESLVALDRLCRTIHAGNFLRDGATPGKLFLNVHGRLLAAVNDDHGHTFRAVIDRLGIEPSRIVIETPAAANLDRPLLALVLANYRINGFRVAVNALGIPDVESVLRAVRPDFIKLGIHQLGGDEDLQRLDDIARDNGVRPIVTRVESAAQRELLQAFHGFLIQGYAVAPPRTLPVLSFSPEPTRDDRQ